MDWNNAKYPMIICLCLVFFSCIFAFGGDWYDRHEYKIEVTFENGNKETHTFELKTSRIYLVEGCLRANNWKTDNLNVCYVRSFKILSDKIIDP